MAKKPFRKKTSTNKIESSALANTDVPQTDARGTQTHANLALWLAAFFALALSLALHWRTSEVSSPTFDEPFHLLLGLQLAQTGSFQDYDAHPPFLHWTLARLAPLVAEFKDVASFKATPGEYRGPYQYRVDNLSGLPEDQAFVRLRHWLVFLPVLLAFGLAGLARDLGGPPGTWLAAFTLPLLEPSWIGLTSLINNDTLAATCAVLGTWFAFRQNIWLQAVGFLVFALAWASKLTAGLWIVPLLAGWALGRVPRKILISFVASLMAAFAFARFHGHPFFPTTGGDSNFRMSYLDGIVTLRPQLTYFVQVFLNKLSLAGLIAMAYGCWIAFRKRNPRVTVAVAAFPLAYLGASQILPGLGWRLVLPLTAGACLALAFVVRTRAAALVFVAALAFESALQHDRLIAYQNPLAGSNPRMADSNHDWGQGLKALVRWRRENPSGALALALFGGTPPETYGLTDYRALPSFPEIATDGVLSGGSFSGLVAVSGNFLHGYIVNHPSLRSLAERKPTACFESVLCVYDVRDRK